MVKRLSVVEPLIIVFNFQTLDQMKKEEKNESKPKVSEYLPKCGVTVDLYCPEQMSIDQLLEIFERRGFKSLVSNANTLEHIVNLYYDHLIPRSNREESVSELTECTSVNASNDSNSNLPKEKVNSSRKRMDDLDNLVITYDVKRFTPCSTKTSHVSSEEHNLTVIHPKQTVQMKEMTDQSICKPSNIPLDSLHSDNMKPVPPHLMNEKSSNSEINDHSLQSMKKRPKINRNFETLTNNI
ncbi:unnamed protein product [Schistosoma rodhaini]|uniref:Uncharacterized protein n=2 Tax=Schistosoma rodhaini TaxID=6188 RepID=A0AA85GIQ1_9TREM|nr:unnamed protein product [Schistosoma rodhaini]